MNLPLMRQQLPMAAPARVLACGAWLKNTACLLDGDTAWMSPLHGDLGTPDAREHLLESVTRLQQQANGPIEAVAHDLHPDLFSTEVAQRLAQRLGVPAIAVQHHHAHIAQVQAQQVPGQALLGWALDGAGLGMDQSAWGGELLLVRDASSERIDHLPNLLLPGGDVAAREPWRMASAVLYRLGFPAHQSPGLRNSTFLRAGALSAIPTASLKGLDSMMQRGLNCRTTTSAGRWFDAVAGLLGVCWWQTEEAQAAIALERLAAQWLSENPAPVPDSELLNAGLNLDVLMHRLIALMQGLETDATAWRTRQSQAAALFHVALADAMSRAAIKTARLNQIQAIALSGGCFFNRILRTRMQEALTQAGLTVHVPIDSAYGDAGLSLGQAWVAAHCVSAMTIEEANTHLTRKPLCV
jgi:hydrogenase maturation protein HypF